MKEFVAIQSKSRPQIEGFGTEREAAEWILRQTGNMPHIIDPDFWVDESGKLVKADRQLPYVAGVFDEFETLLDFIADNFDGSDFHIMTLDLDDYLSGLGSVK